VEETRLFLLMKEDMASVAVLSSLRQYFCGYLVDHRYVNLVDSSLELLAPLAERTETIQALHVSCVHIQ